MFKFNGLSWFHEDEPSGLNKTLTGQMHQVLPAGIAIEQYWQKDAKVWNMAFWAFKDSKNSIYYEKCVSNMQERLDSELRISILANAVLQSRAFDK